jgi:hypothetical protein
MTVDDFGWAMLVVAMLLLIIGDGDQRRRGP